MSLVEQAKHLRFTPRYRICSLNIWEKRGTLCLVHGVAYIACNQCWSYLGDNRSYAQNLVVVNVVGTQLRDLVDSKLTRWR